MKKILMILILALAFITCDDGKDTTTHTHTFGDWQSNAEQHWKECSCGEKTDIGNHTGNPCTVCGYETEHEPQPKTITQADGLAFDGTVTISTSDLYLNADWDTVVASVITALESAYDGAGNAAKNRFRTVFSNDAGAQIVLVNNLANNWEVRAGEFSTLYLKTGSIATADYREAIAHMETTVPGVGNANSVRLNLSLKWAKITYRAIKSLY